jgi:hypothetical protein
MMRPLWDLHWWDEASVDSLLSSVHEVGHERRDVFDLNRNWRRCDDDQLGLMRLHKQKLSLQDSQLAFGAALLCYTRTSVLRFNTRMQSPLPYAQFCCGRAACHLRLYDHTLDFSRILVLVRPTGMVLVGLPCPRLADIYQQHHVMEASASCRILA